MASEYRPSSPHLPKSAFFQAVEFANEGAWIIDPEGGTLYANPKMAEMLGYSVEEMLGKSFYDFMAPEHRTEAMNNLEKRNAGLREDHEFQFQHKDGHSFWASLSTHSITNHAGDLFGAVAFVRDTTEKKMASQDLERLVQERTAELDASRSFLDSLIENLPVMVFVKSADDLRFVRFNRSGLDLLGFKSEEIIGKNDYDFFPPTQAKWFIDKDRTVLAGKKVVDIPEEEIRTRHQGTRILHTKKIPWLGKDGKAEYLLGISEDITEKKKASLERMSLLSDVSAALTTSLNYHSAFEAMARRMVPSFCDWCTVSVQKESGEFQRVVTLHRDPNFEAGSNELKTLGPSEGVKQALRRGETIFIPVITEDKLKMESGEPAIFNIVKGFGVHSFLVVPIMGRGRVLGALSCFLGEGRREFTIEDRDLAEEIGRRAGFALENAFLYESAQTALELRDEFLSIASHELKTPITSVKMNLQFIQRTFSKGRALAPEQVQSILGKVNHQIDRLVHLIEDLLDVSRIRSGKLGLKLQRTRLDDLIRGIVETYELQLSSAGCPLHLDLDPGVIGYVDPLRVEQVLMNLLSNAVKYCPGKPIEILLKRNDDQAEISVIDHGPGISEEQRVHLFERFSRGNSTRNISGLGLGLFISREIARQHGGDLEMEANRSEGTRFTLRLPLRMKYSFDSMMA